MALQEQQQWNPSYSSEQTRSLISQYQSSPQNYSEDNLNLIREHAQYHGLPFYEGDFSILQALQQAGAGFFEGFTTLRTGEHPDNEWESVARSVGHLVGFVPGILSGPLKALGLMNAARGVSAIKSVPMLGADLVTKQAKKVIRPILKNSRNSRFSAVDSASKFMLGEKAKHLAEGAFHLGTASAISSVWDGVDQMMQSFLHGGVAGGVFRTIGNVIPGTTKGDKFIKGLAGSLFMGIPTTMRGATTPEQIYEYLAGAYFGSKELDWKGAKAAKTIQKFEKEAETNPKLEFERNPEDMTGWDKVHPLVQKEVKKRILDGEEATYGTRGKNLERAYDLMEILGITDKIPAKDYTTKGYEMLSNIRKGEQKASRKKAHEAIGVAASGGARGSDAYWSKLLEKHGVPVIHFMPDTKINRRALTDYFKRKKRGEITGVDRGLSDSELFEAGPALERANITLKRPIKKDSSYEFLARNWYQVKNANAVYAIGPIEFGSKNTNLNGRTVKGGTGWAVQMAVDANVKHINVFDTAQKEWFKWSPIKNRFMKIQEAPSLRRNSAVVGTRGDIRYKDSSGRWNYKLSKAAKQAMEDVVQKTFGDAPIKKTKAKDAIPEKKVLGHSKTVKQIRNIRKEIVVRQRELDDINLDLKEGKLPRTSLKKIRKEKVRIEKEIKELEEDIKLREGLEQTEYIDYNTGEVVNDLDIGMTAESTPLMKKGERFSSDFLKEFWDKKDDLLVNKRDKMLEGGKKAEEAIRMHTEVGEKNVKWEKAVEHIQKELGLKSKLSDNAQRTIKKWLTEQNLGKQVIFVKTNRRDLTFTDPMRPTSSDGKALRQVEPPKLIEEVYLAEGGKLEKGVAAPLVVLDSMLVYNKKGFSVEVPLNDLVNHYRFSHRMKENDAIEAAKKAKAKVIKEMAEKHNMYPMGGQGDKGRINFVKFHPKSRDNSKKNYLDIIKVLKTRQVRNEKGKLEFTDKKALGVLNKDMKIAKAEYGISNKNFKKMVVSNMMYDLNLNGFKYSPENIKTVVGEGFIPSAVAYNKRAQIWMTNGYSGNKEFISKQIDDMSPENNYRYVLIGDPTKPKNLSSLKALNVQLPEHVDGAILVRQDVINAINLDAAHPKSGQNKSFIIDNTPDYKGNSMGALLGKYMMHTVGDKASAEMKKEGVHMMIMTSSAKQTGTRKVGDYEVGNKGELKLKGTEHYELNPGNVKYNSSVVNDHHMVQSQIWVKQLFTNLNSFGHSPISQEMIADIHKETIQKAYDGKKQINNKMNDYLSTLDNKKVEDLVRNLEDIGTNELITALKTPGAERFAEMAMQRMLRVVEKDIEAQFREGEISMEQRADAIANIRDSISPIDRLLKNVAIVGEEAAKKGNAGFSGYLHKNVRDYRAAVLHNYFVKSITRPNTDNSAVARMRPFDKWMQRDFKDLNTRDDIFYLDNAYKETRIKLADGTTKTLGELWKSKDPAHKDIFNALVLRVPMDSISGAHKLQFKGFTGREGHGIMLHARSMRALGGADLDGDEAFIYFGGKKEDGTGFGMKQSWMDAIHKNKGEFYKGGDVNEAKTEEFKKLLTEGYGNDNPLKTSKSLYYSPVSRLKASEGAVSGRDLLGTIVSQAQNMRSAYNSLIEAEGKKDQWSWKQDGNRLRITITPKESNEWRRYQRELTRAQIAFGSDPLDEAGLKHRDVFFNTLHEAYFNTKIEIRLNDKGKYVKSDKDIKPWMLKRKGGLLNSYMDMNSAYFGRNHAQGRRWSMDEVNDMASNIRNLTEKQKNTMLPKIVETLEGLDWSDSLFNRLDLNMTKNAYGEINQMVTKFNWLKPLMARSSFRVPYNDQIDIVLANNLNNRHVRRAMAEDTSITGMKNLIRIIRKTPWYNEIKNKKGGWSNKFLYDSNYKFKLLSDIVRQSEDFMSNDLADMATLLNIKRLMDKYKFDEKKIKSIHRKTEMFKAKSYLLPKERRKLDTGAYLEGVEDAKHVELTKMIFENPKLIEAGLVPKPRKKDLKGDERSATWDQMKLDNKIYEYKSKLNGAEKELFDHLMIGTLNRGKIGELYKFLDRLSRDYYNPMLRSLVTKLVKDAAGTKQTRLALNSEAIEDINIQNHFRAMNNVYGKMWEQPTEESIKKKSKEVEKEIEDAGIGKDKNVIDELVQGAHKGEGYAGIKKGELNSRDKELITDIATILKRYNNKIGENIPDLNEQIRGITFEATGKSKDLNALHRRDFEMIRSWLREAENGTIFQRIWRSKTPEMQKRYWSLFPDTINRELMAYDIKWLKKEGWFMTSDGTVKKGTIRRPTYFLEVLQNWVHKSNTLAQGEAETISKDIQNDFIHLKEHKEGNDLFQIAVAQREQGVIKSIEGARKKGDITEAEAKAYKSVYWNLKNNTEKELNWSKLKDKEFVVPNDKGDRISVTGKEIIEGSIDKNLTGINQKLSKRFESLHGLIRGDEKVFKKYQTGKYFDPETKTQPIMNWKKFIKDAQTSFEKGDKIKMEVGIDGMRHIMRSMMYELGARGNNYNKWVFNPTGKFEFESYWPHMFFDKGAAERSMRRALDKVQKDSTLKPEEKEKALRDIVMRHKSLTGDWQFAEVSDWDKVDILSIRDSLKDIAKEKAKKKEVIKWADMKISTGSLFSRKGHVEGWSTDMNVMDTYVKNITNAYYKQLNQIIARDVIDKSYKRMRSKFGAELAGRWSKFFKLYTQGAMGQPDVIPEDIYNDPKMKLKGTPYSWWADNRVLDRVNSIRRKLGLKKSDLPKELEDFTYQDIRNWSNMEAKFELAALLAHPKSAVTNLFGGSLHTIQSAGPAALMKARSVKWLKRINPEWNSIQDVEDFVVKKGVVPEFMVHELGLGKEAKGMKGIEAFIGDLTSKINSKDPIARKEILSLGKKHGLSDTVISKASKFMSVPERTLRRDAFMAHYVRAWEQYGGMIKDPNHPFLIETAKKGVKATQFLYEAPQRPFFARTALGKVMTRFQLYAWNSVRFRNDVIREAKRYGFKPGTAGYEKFKRTMTIDLFVAAMGSIFMYSLFDTAMPQPYSWLQDTANWIFGNEKERERAFYGTYPTAIAPLQMISPPIARIPMSVIMSYAKNDWSKLTDYQAYTFFPFGRIIRDIFQPGRGLIDNPSRLPEKFLGLPLQDISRFQSQRKDEIEEGTRYDQPKPGMF